MLYSPALGSEAPTHSIPAWGGDPLWFTHNPKGTAKGFSIPDLNLSTWSPITWLLFPRYTAAFSPPYSYNFKLLPIIGLLAAQSPKLPWLRAFYTSTLHLEPLPPFYPLFLLVLSILGNNSPPTFYESCS